MSSSYQEKSWHAHKNGFRKIVPADFMQSFQRHANRTMCGIEVAYNAWQSVKYIEEAIVIGDKVKCGTWKGGILAIMADQLRIIKSHRNLIGIDTFEGHPEPAQDEYDIWGNSCNERFKKETELGLKAWAKADFYDTKEYLKLFDSNVKLIKREIKFDSSLDEIGEISLLRLDMDWYEPTLAALEQLEPRVAGG